MWGAVSTQAGRLATKLPSKGGSSPPVCTEPTCPGPLASEGLRGIGTQVHVTQEPSFQLLCYRT